jgi:hypothetical protein
MLYRNMLCKKHIQLVQYKNLHAKIRALYIHTLLKKMAIKKGSVSKSYIQCKKKFAFVPSSDRMSPTKLPLAGNNLSIPGQGEFGE